MRLLLQKNRPKGGTTMRVLCMAASLALWTLSGPSAEGQSISLDHTDGLHSGNPTELVADGTTPIVFYLRITGDGASHGGITNGFRVYSPDGATWTTMQADTTGTLGRAQLDGGVFINHFGVTGSAADTAGIAGFRFFGVGLPAGFDDVAYTIRIGPIQATDHGKTICLDSSFFPPSGVWKFVGPDVVPGWDGPHCFTCVNPGATGIVETNDATQPDDYSLSQNYPNPFNPATSIEFGLPEASHVELAIYNVLGREVARLVDLTLPAGTHRTVWDGRTHHGETAPAGVYFYQLKTEDFVRTRRMLLVK